MTRYAKVASRLLHKIPDNVSFDHASMTEPCAVAYSATIAPGHVRPGDRIVILGPGPIGILSAAMAKECGLFFSALAILGLLKNLPPGFIVALYHWSFSMILCLSMMI